MITFPFTLFAETPEFLNEWSTTFDGVDEVVTMPNDAALDLTNNFTMSAWVKTTQTVDSAFLTKFKFGGNGQYFLGQSAAGGFRVILSSDGGLTNVKDYVTTELINDGNWHFVMATFATNVLNLYVDGALTAPTKTIDATVNSLFSSTALMQLSSLDNSPASFQFEGKLDEVGIWDVVLGSFDIVGSYNDGTPIDLQVDKGPTDYNSAADLVAWWRMGDGDNATTIFDHEGTADGTLVNMNDSNYSTDVPPDWSTKSLSFDGVNEYLNVPDIVPYTPGSELAVSMWINANTFAASNVVFGKGNNQSNEQSFFFQTLTGGNLYFFVSNDGSAFTTVFSLTPFLMTINTWHHVVCQVTATDIEVYMDGVFAASTAFGLSVADTPRDLLIGVRENNGSPVGSSWDGEISNFTYYNTSLSAGTITDLYNSGEALDSREVAQAANIIGYWRLGDTVGDVATGGSGTMIDISANTNDGDLPNGASIVGDAP